MQFSKSGEAALHLSIGRMASAEGKAQRNWGFCGLSLKKLMASRKILDKAKAQV